MSLVEKIIKTDNETHKVPGRFNESGSVTNKHDNFWVNNDAASTNRREAKFPTNSDETVHSFIVLID